MKRNLLKSMICALSLFFAGQALGADYIIPVNPGTNCYDTGQRGWEYDRMKIWIGSSGNWADFYMLCPTSTSYIVYAGYLAGSSAQLSLYINDNDNGWHPFSDPGWENTAEVNCGSRGFNAGSNKISACYGNGGYNIAYFRLHNDDSQTTVTTPTNLNLYFDSYQSDGDGVKVITGSDFMYDQKAEDYIKRSTYDSKQSVTFKANTVAMCRKQVTFSSTGTYTFTFHTYATESYTCTKPYIYIGTKLYGGGTYTSTAGSSEDITIDIDVTAGTYPITFYFPYSGKDEKLWYSSVDIAQPVTIPDHVYVYGDVNNIGWHANNAVDLTYNSTTQLFTGDVTFQNNRYFRFSTVKANDDNSGGWDYVNGSAYGASTSNATPSIGASNWNSLTSGTNNYQAANANVTYFMTVDWVNSRFSLSPYYNVSYSAGTNGAFATTPTTSTGATVSNNTSVPDGETVTFTALPSSGYKVDSWTVNGVVQGTSGNTLSVTITSATTVAVSFTTQGSLVCSNNKVIQAETGDVSSSVTILNSGEAHPASNDMSVSSDGSGYNGTGYIKMGTGGDNGKGDAYFPFSVSTDNTAVTITVRYKEANANVYANIFERVEAATGHIQYNGHYYNKHSYRRLGGDGNWTWYSDFTNYSFNVTLYNKDYILVICDNNDGKVCIDQITLAAGVGQDVFCEEPAATYALTLSATNGTAVSDQPDNSSITENTSVTVTATPSSGYRFDHWENGSGTILAYANPYTFSMTANLTLRAVCVTEDYCTAIKTIEVEGNYLPSGAVTGGTRHPASLTTVAKNGNGSDYPGTCHGTGYVNFQGGGSDELYLAIDIPEAGNYQFYASAGQNKDMYLNVYTTDGDGSSITYSSTTYRKKTNVKINESNGDEKFIYTEHTSTVALPQGMCIVGLYAGWSHACFDQVVVQRMDGKSVFCPAAYCTDETINGNQYAFCLWNDKIAQQTASEITVTGTSVNFNYTSNDAGAEFFYPVTLIAATYDFTISHTNDGENRKFRIYKEDASGTIYYSGKKYLQVGSDETLLADGENKSYINGKVLTAGSYLFGLYCTKNTRFNSIEILSETCSAVSVPTYSLTLSATNGTAVSDQINNAKILSGTSVTLLATPNSGYRFVRWSDNDTNNPRTLTITANTTLSAVFEAIPSGGCANTFTIDCTSPITPTSASTAAATTTEVIGGHIINKDANKALYYLFEIPADATYTFTLLAGNHDKTQTLDIYTTAGAGSETVVYGGVTYKKATSVSANTPNSGQNQFYPVQTASTALTVGKCIIGLSSVSTWSQYEKIVLTGASFCDNAVYYSYTEHGTLTSAKCDNVSFTSGAKFAAGQSLQFTATPDAGYGVQSWWVKEGGGQFVEQGNTQGQTTFNYTVLSNDIEVQVRFAPTYTLTLACNPVGGGTPSGAGLYVAGQVVHINVTPAANHTFQSWTNNSGYQVSAIREFDYVMPAANTTLTANFLVTTCSSTYTIQCETEYVTITSGTGAPSALDVKNSGGTLYYSSYHGTGYLDYKSSSGETYYFVHLPAGSYSFTVYHINGSDKWLNIYSTNNNGNSPTVFGGVTYYKQSWDKLTSGENSGQAAFTTNSVTKNNLAEGDYLIGLWGQNNTAYDQIVISETGDNQVFCETDEDLFMIGNIYGTDYVWTPNPAGHEGQMQNQGNGVYTIRTRIAHSVTPNATSPYYTGGGFALTTVEGDWSYVNSHRYGPSSSVQATENGGEYTFSSQNNDNKWTVPFAGTYTVTANVRTRTVKVEGPELYIFGQTAVTGYNTSSSQQMTYDTRNECYVIKTRVANSAAGTSNGKVSFSVAVSGDATYVNNNRYGPATDNFVPDVTGNNNAIALNGNKWFSVPAGNYIIRVSKDLTKVTFCSALEYVAWTGSVSVSSDYSGKGIFAADTTITAESQNWWLHQVVLGPEHFQSAQVGDTLKVTYTNVTEDPKGALQSTKTYNELPGRAYHTSNGTEVTYDNGSSMKDFFLPANGYYHIITAASLDSLKTSGVIVKGKGHTLTKVSLHAKCDNYSLLTAPFDNTNVATAVDLRDDPYLNGSAGVGGFDLGTWEHQLTFPKENFRNVSVGDYINVYVTPTSNDSTISFRCNVESILADDKRGKVCPSYGNISFDRTIDNLDGDAPEVIGSNNYAVITMEVTADMKRRLDETGFIIMGKDVKVFRVECVVASFVIGSETTVEEKRIPTVVKDLTIWQGSQATNTDDVDVRGTVTYVRPAVGGMHLRTGEAGVIRGNQLDHWYTFTVPFNVSNVTVYDKSDKQYWGGIQSIYRVKTSGSYDADESVNPSGMGYYYLQWLKTENLTGKDEIFRARWEYVDEEHSSSRLESETYTTPQTRFGYPNKNVEYIILFDTYGSSYFATNNEIRFVGGPQIVNGSSKAEPITEDGSDKFFYYANNTMHSMEIPSGAYVLNEKRNLFEYQSNPTILPFECYVQATASYKARYRVINFYSLQGKGDVATDISDAQSANVFKLWLEDNALIRIYDVTGRLIREQRVTSESVRELELPKGTYLLQHGDTTIKVIL